MITTLYYSVLLMYILAVIIYKNRYWFIRKFKNTLEITFLEPEKLQKGAIYRFGSSDGDMAVYVGKNKFKPIKKSC